MLLPPVPPRPRSSSVPSCNVVDAHRWSSSDVTMHHSHPREAIDAKSSCVSSAAAIVNTTACTGQSSGERLLPSTRPRLPRKVDCIWASGVRTGACRTEVDRRQ
eukprot:5399645-Prymnesium_polylepis.2